MRGLGTEEVRLLKPPRGTRLESDSVPLEEAVWKHLVGWWRPEPVKWRIRRYRGGSGDKKVSTEEATLQRPSRGPHCSPPLCHPVTEGQPATTG